MNVVEGVTAHDDEAMAPNPNVDIIAKTGCTAHRIMLLQGGGQM